MIADQIRQKNIDANMEAAIQYHPESFGTVMMLYINCKYNEHPDKVCLRLDGQSVVINNKNSILSTWSIQGLYKYDYGCINVSSCTSFINRPYGR